MTESLARLAVDLTANVAGFTSDLGRANREAQKFGRNLEAQFKQIGTVMAAGFTAGFAAVSEGVRRSINEMDRIGDVAAKINVSVEALSALGYAASQSGSDAATLEKGLKKLSITLADAASGGEAQRKLFQALGVSAADSAGKIRPVEDVFVDLADKFREYKGGAAEVKLATELFGKAGADLIPLLDEGSAGIAGMADEAGKFGAVLSTEAVQQAQQFNDNLDKLQTAMQGVFNELAANVLPMLTAFSQQMVDNTDKAGQAGERFKGVVAVFQAVAIAGAVVKNTWEAITNVIAVAIDTVGVGVRGIQEGATSVLNIGEAQLKGGPIAGLRALATEYTRMGTVQKDLLTQLETNGAAAFAGISDSIADVKKAFDTALDPIVKFEKSVADAGDTAGTADAPIVGVGDAAAGAAPKVDQLRDATADLKREQQDWAERLRDTEAMIRGPLAQANLQLDRQLDELGQDLAEGSVTAEQFAKAKEWLIELHKREADAIRRNQTPVEQMIKDLEFELELMKLSNVERETAIALRQLDGKATEEQAAKLRELFSAREMGQMAKEQSDEFMRVWDDRLQELGQRLVDVFKKGGGSIGDKLGDALKESIGSALNELANGSIKKIAASISSAMDRRNGGSGSGAGGGFRYTDALNVAGAIGMSYVGGESTGASVLGGAAAGAAYGAEIGSIIPVIGTAIGAVVGAIIGAIVGFVSAQKPQLEVSSSARGIQAGQVEGQARSRLGNIFVGKEDFDFDAQQFADQIAQFDNALAGILSGAELDAARGALANFDVAQRRNINPEEILAARFNAVVAAIEPEWVAFLGTFEALEDRVKQFEGLRNLVLQVDSLDDAIRSLNPDSIEKIRFALHNLDDAVTTTATAFNDALAENDAAATNDALNAYTQAIARRYQAEVEMIRALQQQIDEAAESARSFGISMAERLRGTGADVSVAAEIQSGLAALRDAVGSGSNVQQNIANLDRFLQALDQWLAAARSEVEQAAAAARARIASALSALDTEQAAIMTEAQLRMEQANSEAQAAAAAQQAAQQAMLAALQEQLALAQQWAGVLQNAKRFMDTLTFSSASPLSGNSRLLAFDSRIASLRSQLDGATGSGRANIAQELLQLLGDRLSLAQGQFQRPSPEYLAIFNATAAETARLRDIAQAEADRAGAIQEQIAALQAQTFDATVGVSDALYYLSSEERTRLDEIEAQRAALEAELLEVDRQQEAQLAELNATARAQYEWAQQVGEQLQAQRHAELLAQMTEITGGLDPDSYLAQRLDETTDLLTDIRDGLLSFLDEVASTGPGSGLNPNPGVIPGRGGAGGGGGGGSIGFGAAPAGREADEKLIEQPIQLVLDGRVIGETSLQYLASNASRVAPILRREAKVA